MKKVVMIGVVLLSSLAVYTQSTVVTTANTVLRRTPAKNGKVIRKLELNSKVTIIRQKGSWAYVRSNRSVGWVPGNSLSTVKAMRLDRMTVVGNADTGTEPAGLSSTNDPPPVPAPRSMPKTISGGVLNGKAVSLPKPPYPAAARAVKASGSVAVQVLIDESGQVIAASAVSGHPLLRAASVEAAKAALFSPTLLMGKPVKVSGVITYNFVP
jgi:TonB family protein